MAGYGARAGLGVGAIACIVAAAAGAVTLRNLRARAGVAAAPVDVAPADVAPPEVIAA